MQKQSTLPIAQTILSFSAYSYLQKNQYRECIRKSLWFTESSSNFTAEHLGIASGNIHLIFLVSRNYRYFCKSSGFG